MLRPMGSTTQASVDGTVSRIPSVDFAKAFDLTPHDPPLYSLWYYSISSRLLTLICSYFTFRSLSSKRFLELQPFYSPQRSSKMLRRNGQ